MILRRLSLTTSVCMGALVFAIAMPQLAAAETTTEFLKSLTGNYAGRGVASVFGTENDKIACKIANSYDDGAKRLSLTGECASAQGKGAVNGGVSVKGDRLSGTFVTPRKNLKLTKSSGRIVNGEMVLTASLFDEKAGKLVRLQQVVSKTPQGIQAVFYKYDNKSGQYERSGSLKLNKR